MKLLLVRHGESEADILGVHEGRADFPLTERGRQQAERLSAWLKENEGFDEILASPLKRARQTAEYISQATGTPLTLDDQLMEWDNGLLAGMSREEANLKYPLPEGGRKGHHKHANTESMIEFRSRAEAFVSRLKEAYPMEARLCIVSHGGMINMLYQALMGLPMGSGMTIACGDTSLHRFELKAGGLHTIYINRTQHLGT